MCKRCKCNLCCCCYCSVSRVGFCNIFSITFYWKTCLASVDHYFLYSVCLLFKCSSVSALETFDWHHLILFSISLRIMPILQYLLAKPPQPSVYLWLNHSFQDHEAINHYGVNTFHF